MANFLPFRRARSASRLRDGDEIIPLAALLNDLVPQVNPLGAAPPPDSPPPINGNNPQPNDGGVGGNVGENAPEENPPPH